MYFKDDFNTELYFKEIKERFDKSQYDVTSNKSYPEFKASSDILTRLSLEYLKEFMVQVLEHENYGEDSETLVNMATSSFYNFLITPFAEKMLDEKVDKINNMLTQLEITRGDIIGETTLIKLVEADFLIDNLSIEMLESPKLLEMFLCDLDIQLTVGNEEFKIKYCIPKNLRKDKRKGWFYCNTIAEMLEHLETDTMQPILNDFFINPIKNLDTISNTACKTIDIKEIENFKTAKELYTYLNKIDIARIKLPLNMLYVFLEFKHIEEFYSTQFSECFLEKIESNKNKY